MLPKKIQRQAPFKYLSYILQQKTIHPQKVLLKTQNLKTLNDFQRLLGDLNWLRPSLSIPSDILQPLFAILKEDSDPSSSRELTPEITAALKIIEKAISEAQTTYINVQTSLYYIILFPQQLPMGVIWQSHGVLEWIHLAFHMLHSINPHLELIAQLITKGRLRIQQLYGKDPDYFILPMLTKEQLLHAEQLHTS